MMVISSTTASVTRASENALPSQRAPEALREIDRAARVAAPGSNSISGNSVVHDARSNTAAAAVAP